MPETWITDQMRAAIGREYGHRTSFPIDVSDIRRWAIAVYYPETPPRVYWDETYAAEVGLSSVVAPEEFNPFAWMTADGPPLASDARPVSRSIGPEGTLGVEPPATTNMLNGGMECAYSTVLMRPGDVITSVNRLVDYHERSGRLGLMLFTVTEQRWTNQRNEEIKVQQDILIRY
jgi:hypothetical protein